MEHRFEDGNMGDVVRVGDELRKQKMVWWPATRQVLEHLERVGYPWSPRVLAERERDVSLSFLAGETIAADLRGHHDPALLRVLGARTRELHDALDCVQFDAGVEAISWPGQPNAGTMICHNDLSPWNTVMLNGTFVGFIDWDLVSYGTREWELAWMCWRWAPIYPSGDRTPFTAVEQANRCRVLLEAYGLDCIDRSGFVDLIQQRIQSAVDVVEQLGSLGYVGFDRLLATGAHLSGIDDRAWLELHRETFVAILEHDNGGA